MQSSDHLIWKILESAKNGKKGVVACDTKSDVVLIERLLAELNASVVGIHAEAPLEIKKGMESATENLSKYDWIVLNQAAGSGVSLEMDGYMSFVLGRVHPGTDGAQLRQLSGRLRAPSGNTRYSFITPGSKSLEVDGKRLLALEMTIESKTGLVIGHQKDESGRVYAIVANPTVVESRADSMWYKNATSTNPRKWYYDSLNAEGAKLVAEEAPADLLGAISGAIKEAKVAIQEGHRLDLEGAMAVTRELALSFTGRDTTAAEKVAAKKHWMLDKYGPAALTDEKVLANEEAEWEKVKSFVYDALVSEEKSDLVDSIDRKQATPDYKTGEVQSCLLKGLRVRAELENTILELAGFSKEQLGFNGDMTNTFISYETMPESIVGDLQKLDAEMCFAQTIGYTCPDSIEKVPFFIGMVLKKRGLETKRAKKTIGGNRVNGRVVTGESVGRMREISERLYSKLMKIDVIQVEKLYGDVAVITEEVYAYEKAASSQVLLGATTTNEGPKTSKANKPKCPF